MNYSFRYWRLLANAVSWNGSYPYFNCFYEIAFYESVDGTGTNLNLGATASASSDDGAAYVASKANNGNAADMWMSKLSNTVYPWWSIDYGVGVSRVVRSVKVLPRTPAFYAKSLKLQGSADAVTWTDVATLATANNVATQLFSNLQAAASATLAGNAIVAGNGGAGQVVIRDWGTRNLVAIIVPASNGAWTVSVAPGSYDISYFAPNCQPICHGPYTVTA